MDQTDPPFAADTVLPPPLPVADRPPPLPAVLPRPWGFWSTLGWSLVCMLLATVVQTATLIPFLVPHLPFRPGTNVEELLITLVAHPLLLSVATLATAFVCLGFLAMLVRFSGYPWRRYFGWSWAGIKVSLLSVVVFIVALQAWDWLTQFVEQPPMPDFMVQALSSQAYLPLLALAIVVAAPVWEELFFRGFMFQGILHSRLGGSGAVAITSVAFAAVHLQYDWLGMLTILVMGALLGTIRLLTGSTLLTIVLHALNNFYALVYYMWHLGHFES